MIHSLLLRPPRGLSAPLALPRLPLPLMNEHKLLRHHDAAHESNGARESSSCCGSGSFCPQTFWRHGSRFVGQMY
jgi:hypothetical protein